MPELTEQQQIAAAVANAQAAVRATVNRELVALRFQALAAGRIGPDSIPIVMETLDPNYFVGADGRVDDARVGAHIDLITAPTGAAVPVTPAPAPRGPVLGTHAPLQHQAAQSGGSARDALAARGYAVNFE